MNFSWLCQYVWVVFLLTSVSGQCSDLHTFCSSASQLELKQLQKCCNISQIPSDSLEIDYFVTETDDAGERWRLDATVRWKPPTEDDGYTYSIDFRPKVTLEDLSLFRKEPIAEGASCPDDRERIRCPSTHYFSTVVDKESANFSSLLFGFTYMFQIQVIYNGDLSGEVTCYYYCTTGDTPNLRAPDCLSSTGDIEFCQNQSIPVATKPRAIEVGWTTESLSESLSAIVYIKWSEPLVVNGNIVHYSISAERLIDDVCIFRTKETGTEIQVTSDHPEVRDRGFLIGYSYIISVTPVVDLPEEYRSMEPYNGNPATTLINITAIDEPTTPKVTPTFTQNAIPSTTTMGEKSVIPFVIPLSSILAALTVVIIVVIMVLVYRRHRGSVVRENNVTFKVHASRHKVVREVLALPEFRDKEVYDTDDIELIGEPIGGGQYGKVYMGYLLLEKNKEKKTKVAVKTTKDGLHASMQEEFLDEIRLMMEIGEHPNIMPVIACKTIEEPYYLITEFMDYGSLKDFLRKCNKPENVKKDPNYMLTGLHKVKIAHQISIGMTHLSSTRYFHGDLAARNILINKDMEVKISDFGLSNDIYARGYIRLPPENKRPVKWYSPEANIHGRCSTKGDVWSYGIVLHEIYCFGQEPYQGMAPREVIVRVKAGYRLEKPEGCPNGVYDIMCKCWQYEPSQRPTFESIKQSLEEILNSGDFEEEDEKDDK